MRLGEPRVVQREPGSVSVRGGLLRGGQDLHAAGRVWQPVSRGHHRQ